MKRKNLSFLALFFCSVFTVYLYGQQQVSGVVSSDDGELLPGVSVVIKGTTTGVSSDFDGNYAINVPNAQSVLVFSYLGMETQDVVVGGRSTINVTMVTSSEALDEVVVTALGITREKKSLGYAVSEVDGDALDNVPQENALNALSGKVSGVSINSTGGPGSSVNMVIRGANSLTGDNQPLFVIDGTPIFNTLNNVSGFGDRNTVDFGNPISDINPDDIENVSILKGASAAALYGSRAGNGVVLITTKAGKAKKGLGVTVTSSTVFDIPFRYINSHTKFASGDRPYTEDNFPANAYGTLLINEGASAWAGPELDKGINAIQWPYSQQEIESGVPVARELRSYSNPENFFQTAVTATQNISIENSSENISYRLSVNNMDNTGFIPNTDLKRTGVSLNSSVKLNEQVKVTSNLNYVKNGSNNRPGGDRGVNPMHALYQLSPHIDVRQMEDYWLDGFEGLRQHSPYSFGEDPTDISQNNPYFLANEALNSFKRNRIFGNIKVDWELLPGLNLMGRYTYDGYNEERETKISSGYDRAINGTYGLQNIDQREINADFLLSYRKAYDNWDFSVSAGGNIRDAKSANSLIGNQNRTGLEVPNLFRISNIAPGNLRYENEESHRKINSLYGVLNLGFANTLFIDLTARNDWSSTLPEGNNSFFYPSISASLLVNELVDLGPKVSLLKLRSGYAEVGNDTNPYAITNVLSNGGYWGSAPTLSVPGTLLNPSYSAELSKSWEAGIELAFFQNRLRADATYYSARNTNQIFNVDFPSSTGYSSQLINAGETSSEGFEASLGLTIVDNDVWNWDMSFIFNTNVSKIVDLPEGTPFIRLWNDARGGAYSWEGDEIGQIVDARMVRIEDPNSEYFGWPVIDQGGFESSDRTLQDADGNRVADVIGNFNPDFNAGMTTSISYKNFTLSMNFDWRKGGQFVSQTYRYNESDMRTQRWLDKLVDLSGVDDVPGFLRANADQYLSPDGDFYVLVGGPTAEMGGLEHTEGGITLNDGVFMPGVIVDDDGNIIGENLGGPGTITTRYQDHYGWDFTRNATFDADFVKLREISFTYALPNKYLKSIGFTKASISLFSRNIILWTAADIGIDPEVAFQPSTGGVGDTGVLFKQGIERYNANPFAIPVGVRLNFGF